MPRNAGPSGFAPKHVSSMSGYEDCPTSQAQWPTSYSEFGPVSDTSADMQSIYFQRLRELTPEERINRGVRLWEAGHAMQRAAIHRQHPGIAEAEFLYRLAVLRYGPELAEKAFGRRECP